MTREDILAMEPGRELDSLVAEKVMKYTLDKPGWCITEGTPTSSERTYERISRYSKDISRSWEVVEQMKKRGFGFVLIDSPNGRESKVTADFANNSTRIIESAENAPEAICKAALLAVME